MSFAYGREDREPTRSPQQMQGDGAMNQPPNSGDLLRAPPADAACARVRGLLRDFVDQDLAPGLVREVAEHVHGCRVCAVELSRSEHEVLRLRRTFDALGAAEAAQPGSALPPDFAARVVEQLVLTEGGDFGPQAGSSESQSHRPVSGQSVAIGSAARKRSNVFANPAGMLIAGLFALFALTIGMRLFVVDAAKPDRVARLEIMYADEVFGSGRRPLAGGDILSETQGLWVRRGGTAFMDWHDLSESIQPAASIEIRDGELQFRDGAPLLIGGEVVVETNRGVEVPMADGSRLALGVGNYVIAAIPKDMFEDEGFAPGANGVLPGDLELQIEVRSGEPAVVLRGGVAPQVVGVGSTGSYVGGGQVSVVSNGPVIAGTSRDRVPTPTISPEPMAAISGNVFAPNGQPAAGAHVWLQYAAASSVHTRAKVAGANGGFVVATEPACESPFAIVLSLPSELRPDLGLVAVDAVPAILENGVTQLQRPVEMGYSTVLTGRAVDASQVPLQGVSVIPCIVDELFGSVSALTMKQTWSAQSGRFKLEQLPARLPHHQRLVLALSHEGRSTVIVAVPERGGPAAQVAEQVIVVPSLRPVSLHGLPANTLVTLLEEVAGLPVGSAAVRRTFTTNAVGALPFVQLGHGRVWMLSNTGQVARIAEVHLQQVGIFSVGYPASESVQYEDHFRPLQPLPGTELKVVNSYRHQQFQVAPIENIVASQLLHVVDGYGQNVAGAQVFAIRQSPCYQQPDPRFLGFTAPNGHLSIGGVKVFEDVFVIGPNGGLAWVSRPSAGSANMIVTVPLQATGRVVLGPDLRPDPSNVDRVVAITFRRSQEMLVGMAPEAVRFATDGHWEVGGLPAGSYFAEVNGQTYPVVVPVAGFAVLTGQ